MELFPYVKKWEFPIEQLLTNKDDCVYIININIYIDIDDYIDID